MKSNYIFKSIIILAVFFSALLKGQPLGCLTPNLAFTDPTNGNAVVSATVGCDFSGLIRIMPSPITNGALTQGNTPCIRIETSLTNANSNANNSMFLFQGGSPTSTVCGTCAVSIPSNSLFTLYSSLQTPSLSHSYSLCNIAAGTPMTYTVFSCYSTIPLVSGTWNNSPANTCQGVFVPANLAIGSASFVITPTVSAAAINQDFGSGFITLDPWQMSPGTYTVTYNFNSQAGCTTSATRTLLITNPFVAGNSNFTPPLNLCPYSSCVSLLTTTTGYSSSASFPFFSGAGVTSNTFCPISVGAGTYAVTYEVGPTAVCGRTVTNNIVVNAQPTIASPTQSYTCINPNTVTLTTSGASSYVWSGTTVLSQNSNSATVTGSGPFTIIGTANGCTNSATYNVPTNNIAPVITGTNSSQFLTCSQLTTAISVNNIGGVSYSWAGPGIVGPNTGNSIVGNAGGNYVVTATNISNGCTSNATVTVGQGTFVTNTPATTGTITCAVNNINLSTTATTPAFNITWTAPGGATLSANNQQNVSATMTNGGTFTVAVTNATNNCTSTNTIAVNVNTSVITPTALTASSTLLNCNVTSVTLNGNPLTGVTYSWTGPASFASTAANPVVTNPGTYSLVVTNTVNGCKNTVSSANITITQNTLTPTITPTTATNPSVTCAGASTIVTLGASLGNGGNGYVWSNGPTTPTISVSAGTFSVYAINSVNGCTSTPISFTVSPPSGVQTPTLSNPSPSLSCTQTIVTSSIINSGSGLSYIWSGPGIQGSTTSSVVNITQAGTYNYTLTNSSNCSIGNSFVVATTTINIVPNLSALNQTVTCSNTTATLSTAATPASSAYTYSWSTNATTPSITVTPASSTNYTVVVTNTLNGCRGTQTLNVTTNTVVPTGVSLSPATFTLACSPPSTTLTANATGAATYSWVSTTGLISATTSTLNVNTAGTYSVFAIGSNGCSSAAQVAVISAPAGAPAITLSNSNPVITCTSGPISVSVAVTSTVPIQSYAWGPASGITGATNTNVVVFNAAGTYTGLIIATNGCPTNTTIVVTSATTAPAFVAGTGTASPLSCTNPTTAVAPTFTPASNLTYSWSGPGIVGATNGSSIAVNQNGNYSVTVTNTLTGCAANNLVVPVSGSNLAPTLTVTSSSSLGIACQPNTSTVVLTATASAALNYTWNTGATTSTISTSNPGTFTVSAFDNTSGCTINQTFTVANNAALPSLTATAAGSLPCGGGTTTLNAQSTNTNVSYSWAGAGVVTGSNTSNAIVNAGGIYSVTVTNNLTNCSSTETVALVQTTVTAQFTANVISGPAPLTVNFDNTSSGAITYSWSLGNNQPSSILENPSNIYNEPGTYVVMLTAYNGACASTTTLEIKVQQGLGEIPEVFTPNGDLYNPTFEIKGLDSYPNNSLEIFNRWGNPVYSAKPYKNDWDGKPNKSSIGTDKLPAGTYYYILNLGDDKINPLKGYIQLQY